MRKTAAGKSNSPLLNMCRYPFLSSELFGCELSQILEKFFEAPDLEAAKRVDTEEMDSTPGF